MGVGTAFHTNLVLETTAKKACQKALLEYLLLTYVIKRVIKE